MWSSQPKLDRTEDIGNMMITAATKSADLYLIKMQETYKKWKSVLTLFLYKNKLYTWTYKIERLLSKKTSFYTLLDSDVYRVF